MTAQVAEALLPALPVALCEMAVPKVLTLDIPEAQVAVEFPNDPQVRFHHRVLLVDLGQGKHVAVTPDEEVESLDLNSHRIVSLLRSAPFPTRIENDVYTFDPISAGTLERLRLEARTMARVLGASATSVQPSADSCRWVVADPGHPKFGTELELAVAADPNRFQHKGASALADLDNDPTWVFCQNVAAEDESHWRSLKQTGPGKDTRIEPLAYQGERRRVLSLDVVTSGLSPDIKRPKDFPLPGPSAYAELMSGVLASGVGLGGFHNYWERASGVSPGCAVSKEHKCIFESLRHGLLWAGLAGKHLAMTEFSSRRVLQIHRAVKRSAKHPNFEGLEAMLSSALDDTGGVVATKFDQFVADQQRAQAQIMKQSRLVTEELEHESKRGKEGKPPKGGKPA